MTYLQADRQRYYGSPEWAAKRRACFTLFGWNCAVCGQDYHARHDWLECHHLPSGYKNFGHEDVARDLRPLCSRHHKKGQMSLTVIRQMRRAYVWDKRLRRLSSWLWSGLRAFSRLVLKGLLTGWRGRPTAA